MGAVTSLSPREVRCHTDARLHAPLDGEMTSASQCSYSASLPALPVEGGPQEVALLVIAPYLS